MRVFVSYAREDRQRMLAIAGAMRAAGHSVEADVDVVRGGDDFARKIEASIRECEACVVLWSPESAGGPWVPAEARLALRHGKRVVSVKLAECSVPLPFSTYHMLDFSTASDTAGLLASLGTAPAAEAAPPKPPVKRISVLGVALVILGVMAWQQSSEPAEPVIPEPQPVMDSGLRPASPCALERREYDAVSTNCVFACDINNYPMRADLDRCYTCATKKNRLARCLAAAGH